MRNPLRCGLVRRGLARHGLALIGALVAAAALVPGAQAQNYPTRPITMVVPFAPGGLTDVPARMIAALMAEKLGQQVVVENKTGASGAVGGQYAARATPDGYTIFANSVADTQNLHYIPVQYSAINDFAMIGWIVSGPPLVLAIDARLPYKTLADLVADAKANPKKISFGTSGPASSPVIAVTQLNTQAGIDIVGVPYRGSGEAARAVAGSGAIQGAFAFYSQVKPLVDDGKVRALAVASTERIPGFDAPTMEELGYKNFDHRGFVGLAVPVKTPKPVADTVRKALLEALETPVFKERMAALGMTVPAAKDNTPERFLAFMKAQTQRQADFAKLTGHEPMKK